MFVHIWVTLLLTVTDISSSSDLSIKPTLMIPPLTEGQEATLTCAAPDSCSDPDFIWIWICPGENDSSAAGNKTKTQGRNSTLTFNPSAKHHGSEVTCRVTCSNQTSAEVTVTLNVTYAKKPEIRGETTLLDGDTLNLTCTADSFPPSTIIWSRRGINQTLSNQTGPDSGTSALILPNMTAEDSGLYFCTVRNMTQNITITVKKEKRLQITGERDVTEGQALSLTCSFQSFPPFFITWTKLNFNTTVSNGTGTSTLFVPNTTAEHSGRYVCTAEHPNNTLTGEVDVNIKYVRKHPIFGKTTVKEGETLNLTCSADRFPPSIIIWSKRGSNQTLSNQTGPASGTSNLVLHNVTEQDSGQYVCTANALTHDINVSVIYQRRLKIIGATSVAEAGVLNVTCSVDSWPRSFIAWNKLGFNTTLKNGTGAASLIIYNVTAEHRGAYICTAKHLDTALTEEVNVTVMTPPQVLTESGCEAQQDLLTCVCISQGLPSPTITWLLLQNQTEYSFNTAVSNHSVKSTLILTAAHRSWGPVCVSSNANGETKMSLVIKQVAEEGQIMKLLRSVTQPGTVIPFLSGMLLSALIFCLSMLCCRKKQKAKGGEALEMVTSQESSLTNGGQVIEYDQIQSGGAAGAEAGTSDVEYSDIKLLMWKEKESTGNKWKKQETADTPYAKINLKEAKPHANEEKKEEEELKLCLQEVAENVAVYSNVTELMDQS